MDRSQRPTNHEAFSFNRDYVAKVPDGDILATLREQCDSIPAFIRSLPSEVADVVHPPYGWSIRQVVEHCVDAERLFGYRALRFASGDTTHLPGWDEVTIAAEDYGPGADFAGLADEFAALRRSNICLLSRLREQSWGIIGIADNRKASVRTIAWLMAGHWLHHYAILESRLS